METPVRSELNLVFFLFHFNDVDHIAPVIWKCLQQGCKAHAIVLNPDLDVDSDPRLQLLLRTNHLRIHRVEGLLPVPGARALFTPRLSLPLLKGQRFARRLLRRSGASIAVASRVLRRLDPDACIFEWGSPSSRNREEFFLAAKRLGIHTLALPHGLNIYLNLDVTPRMREIARERKPIRRASSAYDAYVFQSEHHRDQDVALGLDPAICHVLGSARYCPEWHEVPQALYPEFIPKAETRGRLKVVFMLPHWTYNVDREATLRLLCEIANDPMVHLVLKEHTRGSGSVTDEMRNRLKSAGDFESTSDASSVSLIRWADVVVNFGSSIGIEALLQGKQLVNPTFLHTNTTILEKTGACTEARRLEGVLPILRQAHEGKLPPISEESKSSLYRAVVYGGKDPHDVLQSYVDLIRKVATRGRLNNSS